MDTNETVSTVMLLLDIYMKLLLCCNYIYKVINVTVNITMS